MTVNGLKVECREPFKKTKAMEAQLYEASEKYALVKKYNEALSCLKNIYLHADADGAYKEIKALRKKMSLEVGAGEQDPEQMMALLKASYQFTAQDKFEDFMIFTEWSRPMQNKFYIPRRNALLPMVEAMQQLADDDLDLLCISCPPGIGKSGLATFFITWMAGRNPELGILTGSHSTSFLKGVYEECLRELSSEGEYLWNLAFAGHKVAKTDAANLKIDIDIPKRFSTLQFASIGSEMAGKVRAQNLLYLDDLIGRLEEALNQDYLEKMWNAYTTDYRQRKQGNCKELHIATRWATGDVIGRLKQNQESNERAKFIEMPALNENDESNFNYGGSIGFTTDFYHELRETMDKASWNALYMAKPVDRDNLLYDDQLLRKYYELPEGEPDAILAVCDTAEGGGDYTVLPVFKVYGNDHYLVDVVCSNELPEVTDSLCVQALANNHVQQCQFESNAAGGRTADKIEETLEKVVTGGRKCHILKKRTLTNKETKIIVNSAWVKEHVLFLDDKKIMRGTPYFEFMQQVRSYGATSKNKHDDTVDALAQYALFTDNLITNVATITKRPF